MRGGGSVSHGNQEGTGGKGCCSRVCARKDQTSGQSPRVTPPDRMDTGGTLKGAECMGLVEAMSCGTVRLPMARDTRA